MGDEDAAPPVGHLGHIDDLGAEDAAVEVQGSRRVPHDVEGGEAGEPVRGPVVGVFSADGLSGLFHAPDAREPEVTWA